MSELYMGNTSIGDEAIELMTNFPKLKKLRVAGSHLGTAGLAMIPKLTNLEELDISECAQISDDSMEPLANLNNIKKLNLWRVNITDAGIAPLAGLSTLQWLNLDNTLLTDDGMKHLSGLSNLTFLHLGSTQITDAELSKLEGITGLKDLVVTRTGVTADGVAKLKRKLTGTEIQLEYIEGK
jgi:Leucine-rich repeat (LRR) protein